MIKYKIVLEYDGTNYSGWQAQKNAKSIQGALIDAAQKFLDTPVEIQGAGRTDAGVHALGQVAHLETTRKLNGETLRIGLNDLLPAGINILSVENAHPRFHARHSAVSRSYLYLIATRRTAFGKKYVWWVKDKLHTGKMHQALAVFEGFHDFQSFADKRMDKDASTKVDVESVRLEQFGRHHRSPDCRFPFFVENGSPHRGHDCRNRTRQHHDQRPGANASCLFRRSRAPHSTAFRAFSGKSFIRRR